VTSGRTAALGFAPHSGWAALIGLGIDGGMPRILSRGRVEMAEDAESKQPYHAVEGLEVPQAAKRLQAYEAEAGRKAHEALKRVVGELAGDGSRVVGVGILESAGRKGSSLAATLSSHALIHTADGDHFRNALARAADRCRLPVFRVRARDLDAEASRGIGQTPRALRAALQRLGREMGPPWTADQKAAALLAWLVLTRESTQGRRPPSGP
jgi:hypothetical protein